MQVEIDKETNSNLDGGQRYLNKRIMTREQARLNAQLVENYLAWTQEQAYLSKEINPHTLSIHFFDPTKTKPEVKKIAKSLDTIRTAESEIRFVENEKLGVLTFDVIWEYFVV